MHWAAILHSIFLWFHFWKNQFCHYPSTCICIWADPPIFEECRSFWFNFPATFSLFTIENQYPSVPIIWVFVASSLRLSSAASSTAWTLISECRSAVFASESASTSINWQIHLSYSSLVLFYNTLHSLLWLKLNIWNQYLTFYGLERRLDLLLNCFLHITIIKNKTSIQAF